MSEAGVVNNQYSEPSVVVAKAKFNFEGKNNDELTFFKNDMITVTQQVEGGWWEGTINGKTGWFPANYACVITEKVCGDVVNSNAARTQFRLEIIRDFIRAEKDYVASVHGTHQELLLPIRRAAILSQEDYAIFSCYIEDIAALQSNTLFRLRETFRLDVSQQRIGGVLLSSAAELKKLLIAYCENHPKAVEVLNEKMDAIKIVLMERGRDVQSLITGLSEPFRHLDKYPSVLQELERNMPWCRLPLVMSYHSDLNNIFQEGHIDRGDVQRSCAVFKEMKVVFYYYLKRSVSLFTKLWFKTLCEAARKQKELQLELLYTGQVEGWATFEQRGRILYVSVVPVVCDGVCTDRLVRMSVICILLIILRMYFLICFRCLALFSKLLIVLEITMDVNSYKLLKKIPTNGLQIRCLDNRIGLVVGMLSFEHACSNSLFFVLFKALITNSLSFLMIKKSIGITSFVNTQ
ncbi:unnamed protein product [Angiostrongylus costaricensis]|uniref:SH3 domain-containing protein n=1 Tax=Angiostrongylus costaricensis TaxID=334426 RepID=A0A0R3PGY0_ANGCS|nr:unnamed protein product [Angiostrongylus costaricensis]